MANVTWQQITSAPEWDSLDTGQRSAVQQKFFSDVIQPNIPDGTDPAGIMKDFQARTADSLTPKRNVGYGESIYRAAAGGLSDTDQFLRKIGGVPAIAYDDLKSRLTGTPTTAAQDSYFGGVVDPAVKYGMTQNIDRRSEKQSAGAQFAGGLARTGTDIGTMMLTGGESAVPRLEAGGAELIGNALAHSAQTNLIPGSRNAADRAQSVLDQGGSGAQALGAGAADFAMGTVLNGVPLGMSSGAATLPARFGMRAATAAPVGALGAIVDNDVSNWTAGQNNRLTAADVAQGAASTALLGGVMGGRTPLKAGDDLFGNGSASIGQEDPTTHAQSGVPNDATAARGYQILRGRNGAPYGITRGDGNVVPLNGRNVNDVIDSMQQMAPYGGGPDQSGVNLGGGQVDQNVIDSTARDVTPAQLGGPGPLALPKPADFEVDSSGQAAPTGEAVVRGHGKQPSGEPVGEAGSEISVDGKPVKDDYSWLDQNPRENPEAFGLSKVPPAQDFLSWVAKQGGLNMDSFKSEFGADPAMTRERGTNQKVVGQPLFRKNGGMSPDDLREAMQQHGWLPPDDPNAPSTTGHDDAYDVLSSALSGKTVVHPDDSDAHAHELAIQQIEQQQAQAQAHNDLANQVGMSPRALAMEVQKARDTNSADPDLATQNDAAQHQHIEDLALHAGVDPMDLHKAFFAAHNDADYAQRVGDLIKEKNDEQAAAVPGDAAVDQAQRVGAQPGDNGDRGGERVQPGNDAGAGEPGGRTAAAGLPGGAQEAVASRSSAAPSTGMGAANVRAAIGKRFGKAGRRLLESGKVQVHDSADTFPASGQALRSDDSVLRAVHDYSTGITHLAADSVTERNVNGVVLHEVGLHDGLHKVLGDRISQLAAQLRVIGKSGKPAEKAMIEEANRRADIEHQGVRDEELVAHTIEQAEAAHASDTLTPRLRVWLADAMSHIKAGLFRMGVIGAHRLGINDIRMLAEGALRRVSREAVPGHVNDALDAYRNRAGRIAALNERRQNGGLGKDELNEFHNLRDQHEMHNPLSGLPNKLAFQRDQAAGKFTHVSALDVDEFKKFNDNFGHGVGDVLLQYVARKLGQSVGDGATAYHLSGDEYAVGSKGDPSDALTRAQDELDRDKININATDEQGNPVVHEFNGIGVSFGVGHDYASADHAANISKEQRAIEGKRERRDGAAKSSPPRRFIQTTGGSEAPVDNSKRQGDLPGAAGGESAKTSGTAGARQDAVASRVPKSQEEAESTQAPPEGKETFRTQAARKLGDVLHDLLLKISPMADTHASDQARAVAKDFANTLRMASHEYMTVDKAIAEALTPEEQQMAWRAANAESEAKQNGTKPVNGLDSLPAKVRAVVDHEQARSEEALQAAVEAGMFDGESALPSYVPRMVIRRLASGVAERFGKGMPGTRGDGANVRTNSPNLLARKHLLKEDTQSAAKLRDKDAEVLENIRTLPIATRRLWEAVAGRKLINSIKEVSSAIGDEFVRTGGKPGGDDWFTVDHPAFTEYARRTEPDPENPGKVRNALDVNHEPIYDAKQVWVHKSFEGPLKAVMSTPDGQAYKAMMALKTKAMTGIMISPAIHMMTEIGRAFPAAPGKMLTGKIWSSGAQALADHGVMREAIEGGLTPIGGRGGNSDAVELANEARLEPGKSWTSKVIGNTVGLLSKEAGEKTKMAIDKAGQVWHEKLLWDQIRKLQAGLYVHFRDEAAAHGSSRADAARLGAHMANRFAGALPRESVSAMTRKFANLAMFSRTFTMGNWGVMKDALTGIPKDIQAQIMRDSGATGLNRAKTFARRAAIGALILDTGLMYVSNSLLQNAFAIWNGSTIEKEAQGYVRRAGELMQHLEKNPLDFWKLLSHVQALTPLHDNEPDKQDRILVGHQADGTAIYMRNPFGKIGEEFIGWGESPIEMLKRKSSTFARPIIETMANDKGFGRKVYDDSESSATNFGRVVANIFGDQFNTTLATDTKKIIAGDKDASISELHLLGDMSGFTFSKGAPGGEAVGEMYHHKTGHEFALQDALPGIRQQIQSGDMQGAVATMSKLGVEPKLMEYYIKTTENPSLRLSAGQLKKYMETADPDERARLLRHLTTSGNN